MKYLFPALLLFLLFRTTTLADIPVIQSMVEYQNVILDSGGPLLEEQAAIDIHFYDLDIDINPEERSIRGIVETHATVRQQLSRFIAHLDSVFTVEMVVDSRDYSKSMPLDFIHENGLVVAELDEALSPGSEIRITIHYSGKPRIAPNPPWEGGFTWERTTENKPWIGVSCQVNGADIWWPVKDHPSDRPDSVSIKITVPAGLKAVSNGLLRSAKIREDSARTFHWVTNSPINNYAVTVNIGPYAEIMDYFTSISGDVFPIYFWALPENKQKAVVLMDQVKNQMLFFEKLLGPYPYRHEKFGVVETPFFGMEHQTIIAYGAGYQNDTVFDTNSGFDDLHHHELAHEWWGNLLAAYDWKDFWIHEGFATYMQPLYAEYLHGKDQYQYFMKRLYQRILNDIPVAPKSSRSTRQMYQGRDIYMKGAWILHSLRNLIGDDAFFRALLEMTYPGSLAFTDEPFSLHTGFASGFSGHEPLTPARFIDTDDVISVFESVSGKDLDWFFEVYLRHNELPELEKSWHDDRLALQWKVPSGKTFPMPVEVYVGNKRHIVVPEEKTFLTVPDREQLMIDPDQKVLRARMYP